MITDLVIENYQSVREARLRLGLLTVITGPTGSGKSAVIRALRLAAFNARGSSFIRHGARTCKVAIGDEDQNWAIGIERGRGDRYRLSHMPQSGDEPHTEVYAKLGGEAPEDILRAHGLSALNFAGQLDAPFLLGESGSQVARMLGELTNVTLVFEAAREAARRKAGTAADLKRTESEVARLNAQLAAYAELFDWLAAQERAEQRLDAAQEAARRAERLGFLLELCRRDGAVVAAAQGRVRAAGPPSLDRMEELAARSVRLRELLSALADAENDIEVFRDRVGQLARQEDAARREYRQVLIDAGKCPMCLQEVDGGTQAAAILLPVGTRVDGRADV